MARFDTSIGRCGIAWGGRGIVSVQLPESLEPEWRWIFYINLPVGVLGFFMASAFLFDSPYLRKPGARIGPASS